MKNEIKSQFSVKLDYYSMFVRLSKFVLLKARFHHLTKKKDEHAMLCASEQIVHFTESDFNNARILNWKKIHSLSVIKEGSHDPSFITCPSLSNPQLPVSNTLHLSQPVP